MQNLPVKITVIIPTFNEEKRIFQLVHHLFTSNLSNCTEVIVSDGGSLDNTVAEAQKAGATVLKCPSKGRAFQMNFAAKFAKGDYLYFIHADAINHFEFCSHILNYLNNGVDLACYRYCFDSDKLLLKFNSFMTKFNSIWTGGGDQSLMIRKETFFKLNGYNNHWIIMEDFEFVRRAKKAGLRFQIIPFEIKVSARKYENNSWLKVQIVNLITLIAWRIGASQQLLNSFYQKALNW